MTSTPPNPHDGHITAESICTPRDRAEKRAAPTHDDTTNSRLGAPCSCGILSVMRTLLSIGLVAALAGCLDERPGPDDNPSVLIDSTDSTFGWRCGEDGCALEILDETPPPPTCSQGTTPGYGTAFGRLVTIAGGCASTGGGWTTLSGWQRPAACTVDDDCPQLYEFSRVFAFECRNDLCQNTDTDGWPVDEIYRSDALLLCFAPHARTLTLDPLMSQVHDDVMGIVNGACGELGADTPCELPLPASCSQL